MFLWKMKVLKNDCFYNIKTKVIFKMVYVIIAVLGTIIKLIASMSSNRK